MSLSCGTLAFAAAEKSGRWTINGKVSAEPDGALLLSKGASAVLNPELNEGAFKDFEMTFKVRTLNGSMGFAAFHSDAAFSKGYKIAIDNSRGSRPGLPSSCMMSFRVGSPMSSPT